MKMQIPEGRAYCLLIQLLVRETALVLHMLYYLGQSQQQISEMHGSDSCATH